MAREVGREKALDLLAEVMQPLAVHQAQVIRETMKIDGCDVKTGFSLAKTIIGLAFGMELMLVEQGASRMVARSGRCPVYETCQLWGVDSK